jgi:Leucine-rich repeat (LRR) protein
MDLLRPVQGTGVFLAVVVIAGAVLADEAEAKKAIKSLNHRVRITVDSSQIGEPVIGLDFRDWSGIKDRHLAVIKELKQLQTLDLSQCQITDQGLKELKELKGLKTLNLYGTPITDEGLKELKDLVGLQFLNLTETILWMRG